MSPSAFMSHEDVFHPCSRSPDWETISLGLRAKAGSAWSWGHESNTEIRFSADGTKTFHFIDFYSIYRPASFPVMAGTIRRWWSNGSSPKTPTCACRAGNASCPSSATKTWPSARNLRRRLWRRSTRRSLRHSQRARYAGKRFSIHSWVTSSV